jgi:hypothetical protein
LNSWNCGRQDEEPKKFYDIENMAMAIFWGRDLGLSDTYVHFSFLFL